VLLAEVVRAHALVLPEKNIRLEDLSRDALFSLGADSTENSVEHVTLLERLTRES
jgi:hypothetical protein